MAKETIMKITEEIAEVNFNEVDYSKEQQFQV